MSKIERHTLSLIGLFSSLLIRLLLGLFTLVLLVGTSAFAKTPATIVPLDTTNNRVYLNTVTSDGTSLRLLFDSGATTSLLFKNESWNFTVRPSKKSISFPALGLSATGEELEPIIIKLGAAEIILNKILSVSQNYAALIESETHFDGIIGQELLEEFILEINPEESSLTLWPHGTNLGYDFDVNNSISIQDNRPLINVRVGTPWDKKAKRRRLLLDSGYPGTLAMWQNGPFKRRMQRIGELSQNPQNYAVIMAFGFAGFDIAPSPVFMLHNQNEKKSDFDGFIGMAFLNLFHYAIDIKRQRIYLTSQIKDRRLSQKRIVELLEFSPNNQSLDIVNPHNWSEGCQISACVVIR